MTAIVQAIELSKQVLSGDQPLTILHQVNFSVATGDSLAILGASGSGKSTPARIAGRFGCAQQWSGAAQWR